MRVTLDNPTASDLFAKSDPGMQPEIPHCVAAANGSWCDLETDDEGAGEEFDEEDFDDDFDDDLDDDFEEDWEDDLTEDEEFPDTFGGEEKDDKDDEKSSLFKGDPNFDD